MCEYPLDIPEKGETTSTVRFKLLVSTIAPKLILLNQQTRRVYGAVKVDISEWYPSCQLLMIRVFGLTEAVFYVLIVSSLHHARDNQDQQRLDQEKEKNGEAKNDDLIPLLVMVEQFSTLARRMTSSMAKMEGLFEELSV
ncbi:hypothetical protein DAPPUDRAFT_320643 [Daphnia pulex]|uniref:Uncharacterized protein n=1 Tax=Daphnia pulex TaxID=6669 RepID=E9GQQ9_DAPPU|nr:hypothetical protein DAPPUDRAFT_320643 [Daphnia pulex]|eukprot:EFX78156.1 hypothetical protein DAPPUDRAFT_320643 [Daphnia pulex]